MKACFPSNFEATSHAWRRGFAALRTSALLAAALGIAGGCSVCQHARRTLIQEPSEYSSKWDRSRSLKVYRQWADQAWIAESGACPEVGSVDDYAMGFRDGFVDYVYAGGDGEPPPVPPRKFWNIAWRNPQGDAASQQWFAGYRHGAHTAREGGYRNGGIVKSSYRRGGSAAPWAESAEPAIAPPNEMLPPGETVVPLEGTVTPAEPPAAPSEPLPDPSPPPQAGSTPLPEFDALPEGGSEVPTLETPTSSGVGATIDLPRAAATPVPSEPQPPAELAPDAEAPIGAGAAGAATHVDRASAVAPLSPARSAHRALSPCGGIYPHH